MVPLVAFGSSVVGEDSFNLRKHTVGKQSLGHALDGWLASLFGNCLEREPGPSPKDISSAGACHLTGLPMNLVPQDAATFSLL
jgi:hypothetical protein